jgi:hypothetical protein
MDSLIQWNPVDTESIIRYVTQPAPPADELRVRLIRRERQEIALAHAAGNLGDTEYLAAAARLRDQERAAPTPPPRVEPRAVVRRLRDFSALWASRSEAQRAEMIRSVYARVEAEGPKFVAAHMTPDARELGLTVALPEEFVMASPAGLGAVLTTIPIVGRQELESEPRCA